VRINNRWIARLWTAVWRKWLEPGDRVVQVTGWRSAVIDGRGGCRRRAYCCFWIFR